MPHVTIQATPNVVIDQPAALLRSVNAALYASGVFEKATDIKTRLMTMEDFLVGVEDDEQAHGFVYVLLKLMSGRTEETKAQLAQALLDSLDDLKNQQSGRVAVQLCVEVEEISGCYVKGAL